MLNKDEEIFIKNKRTLEIRKPNFKFYLYPFIFIGFIFSSLGFSSAIKWNRVVEKIPVLIYEDKQELTKENVENYVKSLHFEHEDIILSQIWLESNHLKSTIAINNNNLVGMKLPSSRPSFAIGEELGHAKFSHWTKSIDDLLIWQTAYGRNLTKAQYYQLLDKVYCSEIGDYSNRLKQIKL